MSYIGGVLFICLGSIEVCDGNAIGFVCVVV
eukprot:SAG11_NODE_26928_length_339_cov_0.645833_1_plen_30_part_10